MQMERFSYYGNPVRVVRYDGELWYVGTDIASILGYEDPLRAVYHAVDVDDYIPVMMHCEEHDHDFRVNFINKLGLMSLCLDENLPDDKYVDFRSWLEDLETVVCRGGFPCEEAED